MNSTQRIVKTIHTYSIENKEVFSKTTKYEINMYNQGKHNSNIIATEI